MSVSESNDNDEKQVQEEDSGKGEPMLVTLFSAPNYPQFRTSPSAGAAGAGRGETLGAFAKVSFVSDNALNNVKVYVEFTSFEASPHPTGIKYSSIKD